MVCFVINKLFNAEELGTFSNTHCNPRKIKAYEAYE